MVWDSSVTKSIERITMLETRFHVWRGCVMCRFAHNLVPCRWICCDATWSCWEAYLVCRQCKWFFLLLKERTSPWKIHFVVDTSCSSVHLGPWVCWLAVTCLVPWSPTRASPLLWSLPSALLGVWLCFWCHVVYIAVNSLHLSPSPCFCCYLHTDRV